MDFAEEMTLLGLALYQVQKVEFGLYGIAAHLTHLPSVASDGRFRGLTPEGFLHGDMTKLRATLGALGQALGKPLMLQEAELGRFIEDRNLIAHNYWRTFHSKRSGRTPKDAEVFLRDFIERSDLWFSVVRGLLVVLIEASAEKEDRVDELHFSEADMAHRVAYYRHIAGAVGAVSDEIDG